MIEKVEEFRPELQAIAFGDAKILEHGKIKVHLVRPAQVGASAVTVLACKCLAGCKGRKDKRCLVKETVQRLFAGRAAPQCPLCLCIKGEVVRIVNAIRPPAGPGVCRIEGKPSGVSFATPQDGNARDLPASQDQVSTTPQLV
jgi:hypothetical protein